MLKNLSVDPKALHKNPWNTNVVSPENEAKLDASLKRLGVFKPILCRELPNGALQIIGGEHRVDSAIRLGLTEVPVVNLGKISEERAKEVMLVDNGRYGDDDALRLAELLSELGSVGEISSFMPYSDADLTAIFASTSIELDDLDIPDNEELPPTLPSEKPMQTHQIMRFKVPIEDVATITAVIERVMRTQKYTDDDSLTNAGHALVHICSKGAEENGV
jgi:ParB-like chromosome segregation protein Spo0J